MTRRIIVTPSVKAPTCQYISADHGYEKLRAEGKLFCGAKSIEGSSYCEAHHNRAFTVSVPVKFRNVA